MPDNTPNTQEYPNVPSQIHISQNTSSTVQGLISRPEDFQPIANQEYLFHYKFLDSLLSNDWFAGKDTKIIESIWLGIDIGDIIIAHHDGDKIIVDGYHRLYAIRRYLNNELKIFDKTYKELTEYEQKSFLLRHVTITTLSNVEISSRVNSLKLYRQFLLSKK